MKKFIKKIFIIFFMAIFTISLCIPNASMAFDTDKYKPEELNDLGILGTIGNVIIGAIQYVGAIVSVIVFLIIGIKYMVGSVEERADYKASFLPYLIGAIMLFSISSLLTILKAVIS